MGNCVLFGSVGRNLPFQKAQTKICKITVFALNDLGNRLYFELYITINTPLAYRDCTVHCYNRYMHTVKRLITEFIPTNYNLSLVINRPERTFSGTVAITGTVVNDKAMVHAHELNINSVMVDNKPAEWQLGQDDEVTIAGIAPGEHVITISYTGVINDQLHGLYPCKYEYDGKKHELLATQFESHYAREVFPCVDEPAAKATFDLTLTTEPGVTVLGNMPVKHSSVGEMLITTFETTPKMSTYLLAFVIGDLQSKTGKTKSGVDVTIYATPAQPAVSLDFALEHSIKTIEFFNDYFGVPYPLPKSDQVALPDFSNGAMENWGLITYRESCLLYDPAITGIADKHYIATVISHELSHQWFGNLVTMAWWDDLWLNESFATIMEHVCVDALYPSWNIWLDFNTADAVYAMRRDSLAGVQSVKTPVNHPDEIQSVFDGAIVYAKGARLMRMLLQFVGEPAFRAGLKSYFTKHSYGNTTGSDLWEALEQASGKSIGEFMNTWLTQSGFPVVHARASGKLTQQQFLIGPNQPSTKLWPIPLDATDPSLPELFSAKEGQYRPSGPYRLNTMDTAHFLTWYDNELLGSLLQQITAGESSVITRAQLAKEQALLAKTPLVASASLIDLLAAYKDETDEKVWGMLSGLIGDLKRFVDPDTPAETALRRLALTVASPMYQKLGWDAKQGESQDDTMLRATILGTMLYGQDKDTAAEARRRYAAEKPANMDPELRDIILIAEVRHGDTSAAIARLLKLHATTASTDLQGSICDAVTSTDDPAELQKLLALLKDTSFVRTQDTARWYVRLLLNRHSRDMTWEWLRAEWPWVKTTFGGDKSYDTFPRLSAQVLQTSEQLAQYKAFFEPMLSDAALTRAITVGINDIEARVELIETDQQAVVERLLKQ